LSTEQCAGGGGSYIEVSGGLNPISNSQSRRLHREGAYQQERCSNEAEKIPEMPATRSLGRHAYMSVIRPLVPAGTNRKFEFKYQYAQQKLEHGSPPSPIDSVLPITQKKLPALHGLDEGPNARVKILYL
ncbi:MAG: hypothetical protein ACREDV_05545, partial [Methylocella sp.]